jgi:two-component system, chemotaxis family, protein-glutamate methylesterase/glutaminase
MSVTVVVCEDSLVQRAQLVRLLQRDGTVEVVGEAGTVEEAVATVERLAPDVVTMDLEMPGGEPGTPGGILAIQRILARRAVPVLVLSAYARERSDTLAIDALDAGAAEIFPKDLAWSDEGSADLRRLLGVLSRLQLGPRHGGAAPAAPAPRAAPGAIVGLVASTGGPTALREVVGGLDGLEAPILLVQHIHPEFVESFASWLEQTTGVPTAVAEPGVRPQAGFAYVAPAGTHLRLGPGGTLELDPEPDLLSRPSGDELLRSLAEHAGPRAVAAVLTGMGDDGARGLLAVREAGGATFAQDGATAVVDGMPRAARELGAAERVLALDQLPRAIGRAVAGPG